MWSLNMHNPDLYTEHLIHNLDLISDTMQSEDLRWGEQMLASQQGRNYSANQKASHHCPHYCFCILSGVIVPVSKLQVFNNRHYA
jgi:hypothetical protein